jgi:hypothetical protein
MRQRKIHWGNINSKWSKLAKLSTCSRQIEGLLSHEEFGNVDKDKQCKICQWNWKSIDKINKKIIPYNTYKGNIHFAKTGWLTSLYLCKINRYSNHGYKIDYIIWINNGEELELKRNRHFSAKQLNSWVTHYNWLSEEELDNLKQYYKFMSL